MFSNEQQMKRIVQNFYSVLGLAVVIDTATHECKLRYMFICVYVKVG